MNRALRRRHGLMIVILAALVGLIFAAAIALRPAPVPAGPAPFIDDVEAASAAKEPVPTQSEEAGDGS